MAVLGLEVRRKHNQQEVSIKTMNVSIGYFSCQFFSRSTVGRKFMSAANEPPMTSSSSSNSNGLEPQLPPLLPPLRSTQHILQTLSVFPGAEINLNQ